MHFKVVPARTVTLLLKVVPARRVTLLLKACKRVGLLFKS